MTGSSHLANESAYFYCPGDKTAAGSGSETNVWMFLACQQQCGGTLLVNENAVGSGLPIAMGLNLT